MSPASPSTGRRSVRAPREGQHTSRRIEAATTADEVFPLIDAEHRQLGTV